ncbi:MAG: LysR family transcriptional regulator [Proteobacteria bacterium ST_bin13]|nr:MAG: LysR family transcriptional regulator [Proteobacteria bacterium ST_bin13]
MRQDQFDGLVAFVSVAQQGGFSAAAVRLGVSASAVSQAIRTLEDRLGVPLFNRTTRSVSLTEIGQRYYDRVLPYVRELAEANEELGDETERVGGLLRLNVPRAGYLIVIQPILRRFLDTYPDVSIELVLENALVDIVGIGFDAGIRFGDLIEKDMIAVRIGPPIEAFMIVSPDYIARRGMPKVPQDLQSHDCIRFRHVTTGQIERWEFSKEGETFELSPTGRLIINDSEALVQSALDGLGIAYMINGYIERFIEDGRLVRVLADWSPRFDDLHLYYADRRRVPAKLRALIDFLRAERMPPASADLLLPR